VLEQLVEDHVGVGIAPQLDHNPHAFTVRLVTQRHNAVDSLLVVQFGDALHQGGLVHHVRNLGHHNALPAALHLFNLSLCPHDDAPAARRVGVTYPATSNDQTGRWKVRSLHSPHQLLNRKLRVVNEHHQSVNHFTQVVRRDVGGHG